MDAGRHSKGFESEAKKHQLAAALDGFRAKSSIVDVSQRDLTPLFVS